LELLNQRNICKAINIFSSLVIVDQDKTLKLYVDQRDTELDAPPMIINGRTMVPIRYIAEELGAYVDNHRVFWHPNTEQVDIVK